MKNAFDGLARRLGTAEERISDPEGVCQQNSPKLRCKEKKRTKNMEQNDQESQDSYTWYNIHIMRIPEKKRNRRKIGNNNS